MSESTNSHMFPTPDSKRVQAIGQALEAVMQRVLEWSRVDGVPAIDSEQLGKWRRDLKMLARSASRPPALGVFGESQVGKSFLISCFSGAGSEILVRDPQLEKTGHIADDKPWAKEARAKGGIPFLQFLNPEAREESTGVICRFTRYPVDQPTQEDCFVGQAITHTDLILSLAMGHLLVMELEEDPGRYQSAIEQSLEAIKRAPDEAARPDELEELDDAWRILRSQYDRRAYVAALKNAGLTDYLSELVRRSRRPSGEAWFSLVDLYWNGRQNTPLSRIYRTLYTIMEDAGFPSLLEIPSRAVACSADKHTPITDVRLLNRLFADEKREHVLCRREAGGEPRVMNLTRPVISALLAELTFPVVGGEGSDARLLQLADVLDFPGVRAPAQSGKVGDVKDEAARTASFAFRRGKLTRLFGLLTERMEITALCLAAPGAGNMEASGTVGQLLTGWLETQRAASGKEGVASPLPASGDLVSGPAVATPPLFMAVTKADVLVNRVAAVDYSSCPLGTKLDSIRQTYTMGMGERNWMDRWSEGQPFRDIFWVHNRQHHPITTSDTPHLERLFQSYNTDNAIRKYVGEPEAKWKDLLVSGGLNLLVGSIANRLAASDKFRWLNDQMMAIRAELIGRLRSKYREEEAAERVRLARKEAERHVAAIEACWTGRRARPRNVLSDLLNVFRIDTARVARMFNRLQADSGKIDEEGEEIALTFDTFLYELQKIWEETIEDRFKTDHLSRRMGLDPEAIQSMREHWRELTRQSWMEDSLRLALSPYFENPMGAARFGGAVVSAACWMWNRQIVELGKPPEMPPDPPIPPRLSPPKSPPWLRILRHWQQRLPDVYAASRGGGEPVPPGNDLLGEILKHLAEMEVVNASA